MSTINYTSQINDDLVFALEFDKPEMTLELATEIQYLLSKKQAGEADEDMRQRIKTIVDMYMPTLTIKQGKKQIEIKLSQSDLTGLTSFMQMLSNELNTYNNVSLEIIYYQNKIAEYLGTTAIGEIADDVAKELEKENA